MYLFGGEAQYVRRARPGGACMATTLWHGAARRQQAHRAVCTRESTLDRDAVARELVATEFIYTARSTANSRRLHAGVVERPTPGAVVVGDGRIMRFYAPVALKLNIWTRAVYIPDRLDPPIPCIAFSHGRFRCSGAKTDNFSATARRHRRDGAASRTGKRHCASKCTRS